MLHHVAQSDLLECFQVIPPLVRFVERPFDDLICVQVETAVQPTPVVFVDRQSSDIGS
jgi:hypothetical protein